MRRETIAAVVLFGLLVAACNGHAVLVERRNAEGEGAGAFEEDSGPLLSKGKKGVNVGGKRFGPGQGGRGVVGTARGGEANCATNSNPDQGFTADSLKLGTIIPLTGALRPLGEQTARVMKVAVQVINRRTHIPGPLGDINWGCPERPGIYGREMTLDVFSMQANTPEEALGGMRRLIDVENVFLVRDCYLQSNLMGAAARYQNAQGVPAIWCHYSEMPFPDLAPWNFSPGIDPQVAAAIHTGFLIKKHNRRRFAILADPAAKETTVRVVRAVAKHFKRPIPSDCIVYKKAQEASNGMRSEIARIRTCYGAAQQPDAVIALDALNGVFGAMEAESQGWAPTRSGTRWSCTGTSCWVTSLAELCGDACEGMYTDCQALPCVPWADPAKYPAAQTLEEDRQKYLSQEPRDILTYGPQAITGGIALWLGMTGPDLSRDAFRETMATKIRNWSAGIGPILTITPEDHFGGKAIWIIKFSGRSPWFNDTTGRFLTLQELGIPYSIITGG